MRSSGLPPPQLSMSPAILASPMPFDAYRTDTEQQLSFQFRRTEAREMALKMQNEQLRQLLEQWKRAGLNIAEREARAAEMMGGMHAAGSDTLPSVTASGAGGIAQGPDQVAAALRAASGVTVLQLSMLQELASRMRGAAVHYGYFSSAIKLVCGLFAVACLWRFCCFAQRLQKGELDVRSSVSKVLPNGINGQRLRALLGLTDHRVEISDIYLGSLFAGSSDVRVSFRTGTGVERRTRVAKNKDGTFLRFDDVLEFSVCGSDAPCTLLVSDRRGDLARKELPAAELVRLANRPHQQYFRTELMACDPLDSSGHALTSSDFPHTQTHAGRDLPRRRPYIAMRLRNVNATATLGLGDKAANKRVYENFAV